MPPSRDKVVLFYPAYESEENAPPLALSAIAGPLLSDGVEVVIVDSALEADPVAATLAHLDGALCLGCSFITGSMIADLIAVCTAARARFPDLPIILGGWHPSILPEQTLEAEFADVVVVRQGEESFRELVTLLRAGEPPHGVAGTLYKDADGAIVRAPERPYTPIAALPDRMPGYELVDLDRYERHTGLRWLLYTTGHGCPYNCGYCSNASVYGRNLDLLPPEQVVDEVDFLVRRHGVGLLGIIDDIFFLFRDRSKAIAEGLLQRGVKVDWYVQDRADSVARLTREEIRMYRRAGLVRIHFGAESGSDRVLRSIEKLSKVENTLKAVDRCREGEVRASFGFIFGLPDEDEAALRDTVDLIGQIYARYERADCHTNIFTPYPGSPLWSRSVELGVDPPASLGDWVPYFPRVTELPWLAGSPHQRLQDIRQYLRLGFPNVRVGEDRGSLRRRAALKVLGPSSRWRLREHRYGLPLELRGYEALKRARPRWGVYERY